MKNIDSQFDIALKGLKNDSSLTTQAIENIDKMQGQSSDIQE